MYSWSLFALFVFVLVFFSVAFVFGKAWNSFCIVVNVRISFITQNIPESRFD
jgi:hypothetical protein